MVTICEGSSIRLYSAAISGAITLGNFLSLGCLLHTTTRVAVSHVVAFIVPLQMEGR